MASAILRSAPPARVARVQKSLANVTQFACIRCRTVFEDALAGFEHQVQAGKLRVLCLQFIDHAQRLQIVFETAEIAHAGIQRILPGMPERRVPEIMRKADRLGQRLVESQRRRSRAPDLRHLKRVRQPRSVQVAFVIDEDLGLVNEAAKRRRMDDAVAIALVLTTIGWRRLFDSACPRLCASLAANGKLRHHLRPREPAPAAIIVASPTAPPSRKQHESQLLLPHLFVHAHGIQHRLRADAGGALVSRPLPCRSRSRASVSRRMPLSSAAITMPAATASPCSHSP